MSAQEADPSNDAVKDKVIEGSKICVTRELYEFLHRRNVRVVGRHDEARNKNGVTIYKVVISYKEVEL